MRMAERLGQDERRSRRSLRAGEVWHQQHSR
jgi:hypothetical protein